MSWATEILRKDARRIVCMEIILASQTIYVADTALIESDKYWSPRLQSLSPLHRQADLLQKQMSIGDVSATLLNNLPDHDDIGYWPATIDGDEMTNAVVNIYLKFITDDNSIVSESVHSGLCQLNQLTKQELSINIRPSYRTKLRILQRQLNSIAFPKAPQEAIGHAHPVVLGVCEAETGAVEAPPINATPPAGPGDDEWCLVAQHPVAAIGDIDRYRGGILTHIIPSAGRVLSATDGEGFGHAYIDVSVGHQEGDEYYVNVEGMSREGYVTLDGTNDWLERDAVDTVGIPGHDYTGSFTIEYKYRAASNIFNTIASIGDDTDPSWWLAVTNDDYVHFIFATNAGSVVFNPTTNIIIGTDHIERWAVDFEAGTVRGWRDGVELAFVGGNDLPAGATELATSAFPFKIGSFTNNNGVTDFPFEGRMYYVTIAQGAQPLTTGSSIDDDPLVDEISFWNLKEAGGKDYTGDNTLTEISLAAGDYTAGSAEENPVRFLQELLINPNGWRLPVSDLDLDTFNTAAAAVALRWTSLADDSYFGGVIGSVHGAIQLPDDQWALAQTIARSFDHILVLTKAGKIAIKDMNTTHTVSTTIPLYSQVNGDFTESLLSINYQPFPIINEVRGVFASKQDQNHSMAHEGYVIAKNEVSQAQLGVLSDAEWMFQFVRKSAPLRTSDDETGGVLNNQLLLRSGKTKYVTWTVPGLWGLQDGSDIGDVVALTASGIFGAWEDKQVRIIDVSADLMKGTVKFIGATIGDQVGSIAFSGEETVTLTASEDTYVNNRDAASVLGAETTFQHASVNSTNTQKRTALRFDTSSLPGGSTVVSASLALYCTAASNTRSGGIPELSLRELESSGWAEATSTWNDFDGSAWNDFVLETGGLLATDVMMGAGFRTFVLNAAGIAYLQARLDGDDEVQLTFQRGAHMEQVYDEAYTFRSKEHNVDSQRPKLTIIYLT